MNPRTARKMEEHINDPHFEKYMVEQERLQLQLEIRALETRIIARLDDVWYRDEAYQHDFDNLMAMKHRLEKMEKIRNDN